MLLTVTTTASPATDLGFLLHKHPGRPQAFGVASGTAHVFYPEASARRCTAALLLEVDPVALVRGPGDSVTHYVNDRPYAASSLLAVALKSVFGTALAGRCAARPELAAAAIPLEIRAPALRCVGGAGLAARVFGPLGWDVRAEPVPLEPAGWGDSAYVDLRLTGTVRLADALNHLYVALPVLDDAKHYWVSTDEVDKLVRAGSGWLAGHPEKELITRRYLAHRRALTDAALARLAESDDLDPAELDNAVPELAPEAAAPEPEAEPGPQADTGRPVPLAVLRRQAVLGVLREAGARTVADLGCGEGTLTGDLLRDSGFTKVIAADVSARALAQAERRLRLDRMPDARRTRLTMFQSSLTYRDARLNGLRRRRADGGHRARRARPAQRPRAGRVRVRRAARRHRHHAEPGVQPRVRDDRRQATAPRPPLRVGPGRVRRVGDPRRRGVRLRRPARRPSGRRSPGRGADPAGRVHPR